MFTQNWNRELNRIEMNESESLVTYEGSQQTILEGKNTPPRLQQSTSLCISGWSTESQKWAWSCIDHRKETANLQSGSEIITGSISQLICLSVSQKNWLVHRIQNAVWQALQCCELTAPSRLLYYVKWVRTAAFGLPVPLIHPNLSTFPLTAPIHTQTHSYTYLHTKLPFCYISLIL